MSQILYYCLNLINENFRNYSNKFIRISCQSLYKTCLREEENGPKNTASKIRFFSMSICPCDVYHLNPNSLNPRWLRRVSIIYGVSNFKLKTTISFFHALFFEF